MISQEKSFFNVMSMHFSRCLLFLMISEVIAETATVLDCKSPTYESEDLKNLHNCNCMVEDGKESSLPTVLNLCHLDIDYCRVISTTKHTNPGKPLTIRSYYIVNLFRRIQSNQYNKNGSIVQNPICQRKLSNLESANCPTNSMSCLASEVIYVCSNDNQNSVCLGKKWNADPYGYFDNWTIRRPQPQDERDLGTATVIIQMHGGPCYFCPPAPKTRGDWPIAQDLVTKVGLFCDERITDEGRLVIQGTGPRGGSPQLRFHLNTSYTCYEFQPKQRCYEEPDVCKAGNTFSCTSLNNYSFSFPALANHYISKKVHPDVEYIFGFCAHDVSCITNDGPADEHDVLICKKTRKFTNGRWVVEATAVAHYADIEKEVILRPTGFVWRSSTAIVSFQCDVDKPFDSKDFEMNIVEKKPLLLTVKHRCFCPNPPAQCTGGQASTTGHPTSAPSKNRNLVIGLSVVGGCFFFVIVCIVISKFTHDPTEPLATRYNGDSNSTPSQNSDQSRTPSDQSSTPSTWSWHTALTSISESFASVFSRTRSPTPTLIGSSTLTRQVRSAETTLNEMPRANERTHLLPQKHSTWT